MPKIIFIFFLMFCLPLNCSQAAKADDTWLNPAYDFTEYKAFTGHSRGIKSVSWSPDNTKAVSVGSNGSIHTWDTTSGDELGKVIGFQKAIYSVAWSTDGKQIAFAQEDNKIIIRNEKLIKEATLIHSENPILYTHSPLNAVKSVVWSKDSTKLISASFNGTIVVWDMKTTTKIITLNEDIESLQDLKARKRYAITALALSPDQTKLASSSLDGTITIWNMHTYEVIYIDYEKSKHVVTSLAWSPDSKLLASSDSDHKIEIWDFHTRKVLKKLTGHTDIVKCISWSPKGELIASASEINDPTIRIWNVNTGSELNKIESHKAAVTSIAWSPDGTKILSGSNDRTVKVSEINSKQRLNILTEHKEPVTTVAWSPNNKFLASASQDNTIIIWDAQTHKEIRKLLGHTDTVKTISWSPDSSKLVSASTDKTMRIWDANSGKELNTVLNAIITCVAWSPNGLQIASIDWNKKLKIWSCELQLLNWFHSAYPLLSVIWSSDNSKLIFSGFNQEIKTLNLNFFKHKYFEAADQLENLSQNVEFLGGHNNNICCLAQIPHSNKFVSGSDDNTLIIWDESTNEKSMALEGHIDKVRSVACSPCGNLISSGSFDNTIRLWDANTGKVLNVLLGHKDKINSIAWSPDGKQLASGSSDNTVIIWGNNSNGSSSLKN
ncbi:MAG: WD40 repeat domain-containing protein [Candidatus Babeliales bacterium]|nr:WD40 repeat domain-containing protein [Candidatus Babeliales bacterium]